MSASHLAHDWYPEPVPDNVEIGDGSWLYSTYAFLHCRSEKPHAVRIGRHCGVYNGCFFELGPRGAVTVGDYSTLVGVIIATNSRVVIGDYCFLSHEVVIADTATATPWHTRQRGASQRGGETSVNLGDDVWVGAGAVLLRGAQLGDGAIVGASTIVDFAVPPYAIVAGNPARIVGHAASRGTDDGA